MFAPVKKSGIGFPLNLEGLKNQRSDSDYVGNTFRNFAKKTQSAQKASALSVEIRSQLKSSGRDKQQSEEKIMKKKHFFMIFGVLFVVSLINSVMGEMPGIIFILWSAFVLAGMLWGVLWVLTNRSINAYLMQSLKEFIDFLRK